MDTDANRAALIKAADDWDVEVRANADPIVLGNGKYAGKTILYTGTSDGFISSHGTCRAYDLPGGKSNSNLAYFELPGMPHCVDLGSGATNPSWYIGGTGLHLVGTPSGAQVYYMPNSTGLLNPTYDALMALAEWHDEKGSAPEQIISTAFLNWKGDGDYRVSKQRAICGFPKQRRLVDQSAVNQTAGWTCE